jgi:hypothetical protein
MNPVEERLRQKLSETDWALATEVFALPVTKIRDFLDERAATLGEAQ